MIKRHGFPYFPVVIPIGFLSLIGIITLSGEVEQLHLVYGAIVAPILLVLGAFSYKCLTAKDTEKGD